MSQTLRLGCLLSHLRHEGIQVEVVSPGGNLAVGEFKGAHDRLINFLATGHFKSVNPFCQHLVAVFHARPDGVSPPLARDSGPNL